MAIADTAKLIVDLSLKGNFASQLKSSERSLSSFDRKITDTQGRAYKAGQQIGTGIKRGAVIAAGAVGFLASQVGFGLRSLIELESVTAQTNAVIKSTGGVAGQTAKSVRDLAEKYEGLNATIDDKVIQSAENVLLTFTAIRKDGFEPAIAAALDMSTALGTDLQGSVLQIGKALQDPIKGITALRRAGVNFSADQITVIKRLVETGDTLGAQKLIIAELNKEFGGSFLAGGSTTAGKVAKFQDAIEDLQKSLASALLPTIGKVADRLSKFLADPKVISTIEGLGESIAELFSDKNMAEGGKVLGALFDTAKAAAPVLKDAAVATLGAVKAAVSLFTSLPKEVQQLAIGAFAINKITGGLVTNLAGGLIGSVLKQLVSGVVNVNGAVVNVVGAGGLPGGPVAPAAAGAAGVGAAAVAGTGVIAVTLAGGAALSLKSILDASNKNNVLAQKGLTEAEIRAVKFFSGTPQYQQESLKHLGSAPSKADYATGVAKLRAATNDAATRVKDDVTATGQKQVAALNAVRAAAREAGQGTRNAINRKKWQFTVNNSITVPVQVSGRDVTRVQTRINKLMSVAG